ncbi:MAG: efflux RND transporter periplasmic adaptor subunit [Bacteroidetes bacterium]|nr:MAG: efflux RND transporter periplasmic adaptor subunit [Bacteroidota bacterium]
MKTKIIILSTLIATISLISCNSGESEKSEHGEEHEEHGQEGVVFLNEKQQEALDLKLGSFEMRNLTTVVKTNGQLAVSPSDIADITAVVGGNVKYIKVFDGDKVRKGQTLAVLEHPDYITLQEDFAEKANNLIFLEQEYKRQKELFDNNVGAGKDFQKAKAEYNTAKAKYEGLKLRLRLLNISSEKVLEGKISGTVNITTPINGYVNEINIKKGTYVDSKTKLFEITNNNKIHADFLIYEKDVHLVKKRQTVHFTVSNKPEEEFTAEVFAIGKEFDPNIRAVNIHTKINGDVSKLIPGMYISGHLHTDKRLTKTLPNDAIVSEGTKSYIFILDETTKPEHREHGDENEDEHAEEEHIKAFKMTEVITGQNDDGYTEIKLIEDLPENIKIVLNAAYYLLADMKKEENEHED